MKLERASPDENQPYLNLMPLVNALKEGGNEALDGGFRPDPHGGWRCRMARSLDVAKLRTDFEIPETISLSEEWDSILDRLTWCVIEGPGASEARRKSRLEQQGGGS